VTDLPAACLGGKDAIATSTPGLLEAFFIHPGSIADKVFGTAFRPYELAVPSKEL
jgi:hypothetical protein